MGAPRKLFIPTIGDRLLLKENWMFTLYPEKRNYRFSLNFDDLDFKDWEYVEQEPALVTLPVGTILKVDRIYIRRSRLDGARAFDSVTFYCNFDIDLKEANKNGIAKGRFWAKLDDVNELFVSRLKEVPNGR